MGKKIFPLTFYRIYSAVGEYLQDLEDVFKENKEEDEIISKNEWQEE